MKPTIIVTAVALILACPIESRAQNPCGWSALGVGVLDVRALEVWDDGTGPALFAGAAFQQPGMQIARGVKWDGSSWTPLGDGLNSRILCMAVFDDGTGPALYAGGNFYRLGGIPLFAPFGSGVPISNGIAKWDGTAWSSVGNGLTGGPMFGIPSLPSGGTVGTLTVFDDGTGPALYAGGGFTNSGGVPLPGLAKWDGNSWSPPPNGMMALTTNFGLLGVFDTGTGPTLYAWMSDRTIRKWSGSTWLPLGPAFSGLAGTSAPGGVACLAVFDDGSGPALYAAGAFDTVGNVAANGIAKWDGNSWSALGNGLGIGQNSNFSGVDIIWSLAAHDDGTGLALYAGGRIRVAGNNIIKWDGTTWSGLDGGLNGLIASLKVFDDGTGAALYAGADGFMAPPPGGGGLNMSGVSNVAKWTCSGIGLALSQGRTPGTGVLVNNYNLTPGKEHYNIFSLDLCPGAVGTGPYGGLCFSPGNIQFLLGQLSLPLGTLPSHFTALTPSVTSGPYPLPPITIEGVCFEINAGAIGAISPAIRFTIQ